MTETFLCSRCQKEFVVDCPDGSEDCVSQIEIFHETHPVCPECEHGFLAWGGCHSIM